MLEKLRAMPCETCGGSKQVCTGHRSVTKDGTWDHFDPIFQPRGTCLLDGKPTGKRFPALWEWADRFLNLDDYKPWAANPEVGTLVPRTEDLTDALLDIWYTTTPDESVTMEIAGKLRSALRSKNRQEALAAMIWDGVDRSEGSG